MASLSLPVVLNIAEKPSVAKRITEQLCMGRVEKLMGYSKWNHVFQFQGEFFSRACCMIVTSVRGHIMELTFSEEYHHWSLSDLFRVFKAPVKKVIKSDCKDIVKTLAYYAKRATILSLWLDCDREGENIAFEILSSVSHFCTKLPQRYAFSVLLCQIMPSLQRYSILGHPINLFPLYDPTLPRVVRLRCFPFRPLIVDDDILHRPVKVHNQSATLLHTQLVAGFGLCQFPTLGLVIARYIEHQQFSSHLFWILTLHCDSSSVDQKRGSNTKKNGLVLNWERKRLFDRDVVLAFHTLCSTESYALVEEVTETIITKSKPLPLTTNDLTILAARKLHLTSKLTMQLAESLYQKGYISYPRTETNAFSSDIDLKYFVATQCESAEWGDYAKSLLNKEKFDPPRSGSQDDHAHPPIHPIRLAQRQALSSVDEWNVFRLIVLRFLACCSLDAQGIKKRIVAMMAHERFHTEGLTITHRNFLDIYGYFDPWVETPLPFGCHQKGQYIRGNTQMKEGKTTPPELLTEADLIRMMNKHGIGTDATTHEHIDTIKQRCYVDVLASRFLPTQLGFRLFYAIKSCAEGEFIDLTQSTLRAKIENDVSRAAQGEVTASDVLKHHLDELEKVIMKILEDPQAVDTMVLNPRPMEPQAKPTVPVSNKTYSRGGTTPYRRVSASTPSRHISCRAVSRRLPRNVSRGMPRGVSVLVHDSSTPTRKIRYSSRGQRPRGRRARQ